MNANLIISEDMTLEEKLAAIDAAMANVVVKSNQGTVNVAEDPADLTMCLGCQ